MAAFKTSRIFRKIALIFISFTIASVYLMLAVVVIMFLFSTLHLINPALFKFKKIDLLSGTIMFIVLIFSIRTFSIAFKKIYIYFDNTILKNISS